MNRQVNHKVMRVVVGLIALFLAPTVWLLSATQQPLTSISISYWTDARDLFVGSLIAVGFFLAAYNGQGGGRDWEYYLSKAACVFAVFVALFPTTGFSADDVAAKWVRSTAGLVGLEPEEVHNISAILLFACLIALMWFFSNRAKSKNRPGRANFYRTVSISMASGIILLVILGKLLGWSSYILYVEIWGLTLFGVGWLVAGSYRTV